MKNKISITINEKILQDVDSIVDNIFIRNRSQAVEYLIKKAMKESKTAVILIGDGANSSNKIKNRYTLKVDHSTVIEKAIKKLSDSGFKNIYLIGPREYLTNIFKLIGDGTDYNVKIEFVNEETPEGTGAALKLLKGKIKTTFLVAYCDIIFDDVNLLELWQGHLQDKTVATLLIVSSVISSHDEGMWGHVNLEGNKILSFIEKPAPRSVKSSIFFGGIFVAEPEILSYHGKSLEREIFPELAKRRLLGGQMSSAEYLHIHTKEDLIYVRKKVK